jgi:erythronate-4-phosphate dehydrogenase
MLIVADANIPYVKEGFAELGDVVTLPSSKINADAVREAEILLVRSTVKVGEPLLGGSRVRFVATATIGIDHLDVRWLERAGIAWASAPGSNADSVQQWFAAVLAEIGARGLALESLQIGIVGVGNVGTRVEKLVRAFAKPPLLCDPPRQRAEGGEFLPIDAVLAASDLVTLHVPLLREGPDATVHLIDQKRLERLVPDGWLVNASRGEVVDSNALEEVVTDGRMAGVALDVFEGEPTPPPPLVARCAVATPHIAGHSLDGKANGTQMVYEAACRFLGRTPTWNARAHLPPLQPEAVQVHTRGLSLAEILGRAISPYYRITDDDATLRRIVTFPPADRGRGFQEYRNNYPPRRELRGARIKLTPPHALAGRILKVLGAQIE